MLSIRAHTSLLDWTCCTRTRGITVLVLAGAKEHDISDSRLENVKRILDRSSKLKWVNLQGPGLTTLTNTAGIVRQGYSPKIEKIAGNSGEELSDQSDFEV